ncbi:methionine ABC transporter ATP-binding protein [Paenibacillus aquistagni]|uniref:D-methionine transport system ATP-binding protein n=1 Tax=Paenibacillus aquistagni TaxID=1852522 RepID=A0A1X7LUY4_9BACL|nr:methionine ABC transporter ATP-binding protein [Paenibacillus aquistagni]SMG56959.1 D-methionine transport system ATP-binding protein [Paenibacillus aquistagni]
MIEIRQLSKRYPGKGKTEGLLALDRIDLHIEAGEIYGIIGHSGAGKSTLLRTMNLLERPTEGSIQVAGIELTQLNKKELQQQRSKIGMIFQHFNLLSSATVYDNIAFPLQLVNTPKHKVDAKVNELIRLVGLEAHRDKYPAQLSGGQKQRVGIARALANDPKVLLCDEATSALDPQTTQSILSLLLQINKQFGITIVLITHEMHVIQTICDRVAVIHGGRIVEQGKVVDVFLKPSHAVTQEFIMEENHLGDLSSWVSFKNGQGVHSRIMKIHYLGEVTYEPILHRVLSAAGIEFAILQGTISRMKDVPYGQLIIRMDGKEEALRHAAVALAEQGLEVEVLA